MNGLPSVMVDCLIVGAGPAGLAAATYLARYRRQVCVLDSGDSRDARLPASRNVPGLPAGSSGTRLLERIRRQAEAAGVVVCKGRVESIRREGEGFVAIVQGRQVHARRALVATGITLYRDTPRRMRLVRDTRGRLALENGRRLEFDAAHPMTGGEPRAALATMLGARRVPDGRLQVDIHQQTSVPGLYAAGDVVASLGLVAVAVAEGAVAATSIHQSLPANYR